jgi:hypothetical protein
VTYTDQKAGRRDVGASPDGEESQSDDGWEGTIEYPAQRGRAALHSASNWARRRIARLSQPEHLVTFVVVLASVVFVLWQFQPSKLLSGTTVSGGDTGAHVLLPWVAQHQVLADGRLTGWTSSNWDGFPAVTFYFPLPVYSVVVLSQVISFNVAMKLVTAVATILLPLAAWAMGRLARAPFPVPAVLAAGTLPFLFGTEFTIYGGNIASTLAGEFAFAWSLDLALVFFGLVMRGLQDGRHRASAALVFCLLFMSHIDPALFAVVGLVVLVGIYALRNRDLRGAVLWALPTLAVGGLLAGWWAWPFFERFPYVTNMGYQKITSFISTLFPASDSWLFILAAVGAALCLSRRRRLGEFLFVMAVLAALAFRFMPQSILWNARVLPFWFLCNYLLAALGIAEIYLMCAERFASFTVTLRAAMLPAPLSVLVLALIWVGFPLRILPGEHPGANGDYYWLGIVNKTESFIPSWISWNYSGYQAGCHTTGVQIPADPGSCEKTRWPEYTEIVAKLKTLAKTYGCGNVMWEYQSQMNDYGTPDALTMLPYWTDGCLGSMEGLYYEASATTPFHFIDQSELSLQPSDPMVGLPYASSPDVALGVEHLQMLGVKYYMALNKELQQQAAADPNLQLIGTLGPFYISYAGNSGGPTGVQEQYWKFYLVKGAPRVHPLANQPVVMKGLNNARQPKWLKVMTTWYDDPSDWDVYLAATGPRNWARVPYGDFNVPVVREPSTTVTDVVERNASVSFNVSRTGVPIVVTVSYFPNWQVSGAKGVYRVSPNLMVVVPTSHHVKLWYGFTPVDYEGWAFSILALGGLVWLARRRPARLAALGRPGLGERAGAGRWEGYFRARLRLDGPAHDSWGPPAHAAPSTPVRATSWAVPAAARGNAGAGAPSLGPEEAGPHGERPALVTPEARPPAEREPG